MVFGFNTDIKVGHTVYHVQTEDRGPGNPVIDTTIYTQGRVLHKRATSYKGFLNSADFSETALRERLEEQHRTIIDELRTGKLQLAAAGHAPQAEPTGRARRVVADVAAPLSGLPIPATVAVGAAIPTVPADVAAMAEAGMALSGVGPSPENVAHAEEAAAPADQVVATYAALPDASPVHRARAAAAQRNSAFGFEGARHRFPECRR